MLHTDLHIHTTLSPCGDLEMSPVNIIRMAREKELKIIGITDHNSTRQGPIIRDYAHQYGIHVLTGCEITTQEEVHCLAFFDGDEPLTAFQQYLDNHLPNIRNNPDKFGYQVVAGINEEILYQEERLLISALNVPLEEIAKQVQNLHGIFIPAHIDKPRFSLLSQLGFVPNDLYYDALELSPYTDSVTFISQHPQPITPPLLHSSDAHYPEEIGRVFSSLNPRAIDFEAIRESIRNIID